jgi:hypothetical protein
MIMWDSSSETAVRKGEADEMIVAINEQEYNA